MRSEARLESLVFQLTPTRTRCDLIIIANGKRQKIASGLLTPFLAHLKFAQDQIAKGGYSIILEPDPETEAAWFTKGTVERFVRFVSTPEVLERVTTIESEILQIENAIAVQGNDNVEDHQSKPAETVEGTKISVDTDAAKAIVLYKPDSQPNPPDSNGSTTQENSKVQLLKVLETRKMVLRKEQGMAFARAAAAGFDMDNLLDLISFSESFGASRLKDACLQFMELWKKKHETGQWLEVEVAEAMSTRSEFSALNASGIIFATDPMMQNDHGDAQSVTGGDMLTETDGRADRQIPSDSKVPLGHQEYLQGQFQHPAYSQWPMHPPPGPPMFQPYPMQGMPYYQNYPGSVPYFHPPYPPMEDPRFNSSHRKGSKRQSADNKDIESETWERSTRSQDDSDQNTSDLEKEGSHGHKSHRRVGRKGKKKPGVVVIRNINYIKSKKHGSVESESGSQSVSESEAEEDSEDVHADMRERKHKHSVRRSKKEDRPTKPEEFSDAYGNDKAAYREEADSGNWQAFQTFLLSAEEKSRTVGEDMFMGEKEPQSKRKQSKSEADPIVLPERDYGDYHDGGMAEFDSVSGKTIRMKQVASDDQFLASSNGRDLTDNQFKEIESGGRAYRQMSSDEFMIYEQEKQFSIKNSSDPFVDHVDEHPVKAVESLSYNITDETFMLPYRTDSQDLGSDSIIPIDMDSEFSSALQNGSNLYDKAKNQLSYEPDDLSLVPERETETVSVGYDPAMDYDFQIPVANAVKLEATNQEDLSESTKEESQKLDKENSRASNDSMEKRRKDALVKKGTSSRLNLLTEAQKRAEKLRSHKVDLQKMKKEREDEELKRLEALKRERQKRIASRSGSTVTQAPSTPQQTKARLAIKPSPGPHKGLKLSNTEPVSSSPLRKLPIRTSSDGSNDPQKPIKSSKLNGSNHGLTRSASSLPEVKKESNGLMPEAKTDSLRMKRHSDPKSNYTQSGSSVKSITADQDSKRGVPDESQKKITAIIQQEESKSATLPELRIKTPPTSTEVVENETASKDPLQKETAREASQASDTNNGKSANDKPPSNNDENPVIEKTVVMLENNLVTAPVVQQSDEMIDTKERSHGDGMVTGYAALHAPPSPVIITQVEDSGEGKLNEQLNSYKVVVPCLGSEPQKFSNLTVAEKSYQAPYARVTSLEDPAAPNLGYVGVPASESEMAAEHAENGSITVHVSGFKNSSLTDLTHETHEKPRSKESKGFRKLLKFGRKSHGSASGEGNLDTDASSVDDPTVTAASSNDVTHSFSLLSPFRSKNSEKKQAA
uniref:COP1-interacting protein-related n=1 Tax=Musa acuminata subsp. malaccensis TaxID=214687 RepID=A0A804J6T9_MUSAM|nr:PREDICTED: uncharacterized protein LOC103985817 isoform X2 [Musa acuminata subsp. malaccensis]